MKNFIAVAALCLGSIALTPSVSAREYRGTCYFNSTSMTCTVNQNPFVMTMRWADGVTEVYSHKGNGVFVDKRGGIWRPDSTLRKGQFWKHQNGNQIGFVEY